MQAKVKNQRDNYIVDRAEKPSNHIDHFDAGRGGFDILSQCLVGGIHHHAIAPQVDGANRRLQGCAVVQCIATGTVARLVAETTAC